MVEESERFEEEKISLMHSEELGFLGDPPIVIWTGKGRWSLTRCGDQRWDMTIYMKLWKTNNVGNWKKNLVLGALWGSGAR